MIAEVFPSAAEIATNRALLEVEKRLSDRISSLERRFFLFFAVPLWGAVAAAAVKVIAKI